MTKLLIQGVAILAQGPFFEAPDEIRRPDIIFPKAVIEGWQIVEVDLPDDFTVAGYEWVSGALSAKAAPQPDLEALRAAKNAEINAARLAANRGSFTHAGKVFACDELSRSDIDATQGYVARHGALPDGWPGGWKAIDNTYAPISTVAEWDAFYNSMFSQGNANFARAQALKAQLVAATTPAQIAGIVW